MKFCIGTWLKDYGLIKKVCLECERLQYHAFYYGEGLGPECWTTIAALSSITKNLRIGCGINFFTYRHPVLLAKITATLDVISRGRLDVKLGAGGGVGFGVETQPSKMRFKRFVEGLKILKTLWTKGKASFEGEYYSVKDAVCEPKPIRNPHPPLIIAAKNNNMLKIAAKYGDGLEGFYPLEEYLEKQRIFEEFWKSFGRAPHNPVKSILLNVAISKDEIEAQKMFETYLRERNTSEQRAQFLKKRDIVGTPDDCVQKISEYAKVGVNCFTLMFIEAERINSLELFAEKVIPAFPT